MDSDTYSDDPDAAFYWDGLTAGRLLVQRCDDCERTRFPPLPTCPYCASRNASVVAATGAGHVYSWVTVRTALTPEAEADVPYAVAVVELEEGCRVVGRLRDIESVSCDMAVRVVVANSHIEFVRVSA